MTKTIRGINKRFRVDGSYIWYIDKRVKRYGRLCESAGIADRNEAERYLLHRLHELREVLVYGERPPRTFKEAAEKYLAENRGKRTIKRDMGALKDMEPFIAHLPLDRINNDSFARYRVLHHCHLVNIRGNSYRMREHTELYRALQSDVENSSEAVRPPRKSKTGIGNRG
jgi:hypothetical protein